MKVSKFIDMKAFDAFCRELDLQYDVKIQVKTDTPSAGHRHIEWKDGKTFHKVVIDRDEFENPDSANDTILHELAHCVQSEFLGEQKYYDKYVEDFWAGEVTEYDYDTIDQIDADAANDTLLLRYEDGGANGNLIGIIVRKGKTPLEKDAEEFAAEWSSKVRLVREK